MNQISSGEILTGPVQGFEVAPSEDGSVALRLNIGGSSVLASLGPVYASILAKELRRAANEIHIANEAQPH